MGRKAKGIWLVLILLAVLTAAVFTGAELFRVDKITVSGSSTMDKDVIIELSGIAYGQNLFKVDKKAAAERLRDNPYVIVNDISLRLPNEVVLSVGERRPSAVIPYLSSNIIIDSTGFILDVMKQSEPVDLPIVKSVRVQSFVTGNRLEVGQQDQYKQKVLYSLLGALSDNDTLDIVLEIDFENPDNILITTIHNIMVEFGQAVEMDRKCAWLKSEAYQKVLAQGLPGILDLTSPKNMVFKPVDGVESNGSDDHVSLDDTINDSDEVED